MERLIFHVDVNSAFLSWEAAEARKEGLPDLRYEIPSCISGGSEVKAQHRCGEIDPGEKNMG